MDTFAFYLQDPFTFDIIKDFASVFPDITEEDKLFLSNVNAETNTIKRNIKTVFKAVLLAKGFVYDKDSGILKVKPKDEMFQEFLNKRYAFNGIMNFFNDIGYVFYHCLLSFIFCFEHDSITSTYIRSHLKDKNLYSYKDTQPKIPSFNDGSFVDEIPFRGLTFNDRNSCYLDSVLMALFTEPSDFIKERILFNPIFIEKICGESTSIKTDIQQRNLIKTELQKIYAFIQNKDSKEDKEDEDNDNDEDDNEEDDDEEEEDDEDDEDEEDKDEDDEEEEEDDEEDEDEDNDEEDDYGWSNRSRFVATAHYNCTNLRKTFENCKGSEAFHGGKTQDAGEFLMYLLNIFELLSVSLQKSYSYGTDSSKNPFVLVSERKENTSPIVSIVETVLITLDKDKTHFLTKFMIQSDTAKFDKKNIWKPTTGQHKGKEFKYRKNVIKQVAQVPFIVFYIKRSFIDARGKEKFYTTKMYPPEKILMPSYQTLHLSAIVIHTGGAHYVAVLKRKDSWWYYNDIGTQLDKIGSYNDMIKFKGQSSINPLTHGTLYFYT